MTKQVTNQLYFKSNSKTILAYLQSKSQGEACPPQFSLNSIRLMPQALYLPLTTQIRSLSALNAERPSQDGRSTLDAETVNMMLDNLFFGQQEKQPKSEITSAIQRLKNAMEAPEARRRTKQTLTEGKTDFELFEQSVANFNQSEFFSQYDWRITNWGTDQDILSAVEETFVRPTTYIEFKTSWAPPIPAIQELANTFPSVKFRLAYRYAEDDPWTRIELFPVVPWGY